MKKIALFDFDKTITREHSIGTLLKFIFRRYPLHALAFALRFIFALVHSFFSGDYRHLKNSVLKYYDLLTPEEKDVFLHNVMPKKYYKDALKEIARRKEEGYVLFLVSASMEPYLVPLGRDLGFDYILGTQFIDGKILGLNHAKEEKVRRLKVLFEKEGIPYSQATTVAYSDSYKDDKPMLDMAHERFLINSPVRSQGYQNLTWD
ncbi:MAG: haloacid dehalogenase-like hydrolase [Peptoniphilus sp. oral taxon 375]|nr:haloacid dehalogenase-like hydrolase [Peptoniphilus sp. oral taxon 375]